MKRTSILSVSALISFCSATGAVAQAAASTRPEPPVRQAAPERSAAIPFDQLGAAAAEQYNGDGLAVASTPDGAKLRCVFQRLNANVTTQGLWLALQMRL